MIRFMKHCFFPRWRMLTPMQQARFNFGMVYSPEGVLYAMGGEYYGTTIVGIHALNSIECISPYGKKARWRYLSPMPYPIQGFSAAFFRGRIFVAGGNTNEYKWLKDVAMFTPPMENTETDGSLGQWTRVDDLPIPYAWGLTLIATSKSIIVTGKFLDKKSLTMKRGSSRCDWKID